jgi:hypothetical protein
MSLWFVIWIIPALSFHTGLLPCSLSSQDLLPTAELNTDKGTVDGVIWEDFDNETHTFFADTFALQVSIG